MSRATEHTRARKRMSRGEPMRGGAVETFYRDTHRWCSAHSQYKYSCTECLDPIGSAERELVFLKKKRERLAAEARQVVDEICLLTEKLHARYPG